MYMLWLSEAFPKGSCKPYMILSKVDSLEDFYNKGKEYWKSFKFLTTADIKLLEKTKIERAEQIVDRCRALGIKITTILSKTYPKMLRTIYAPPIVLYYKGNISCINDSVSVSYVGTRYASDYSIETARKMSYNLAKCGCVVVSGCAVGIDSAAHQGALDANGLTVGVMACGLDINYPIETADLRANMIKTGGAIVSELSPGDRGTKGGFYVRNRLMSGMTQGTIIGQAPKKSGALLTANHAVEQGRDLFIVPPHDIYSDEYTGVVSLLRDGAKAVYDHTDVIVEYKNTYTHLLHTIDQEEKHTNMVQVPKKERKAKTDNPTPITKQKKDEKSLVNIENLTSNQRKIYEVLSQNKTHIEQIVIQCGLPYKDVISALTMMEIMGVVLSYPGQNYSIK